MNQDERVTTFQIPDFVHQTHSGQEDAAGAAAASPRQNPETFASSTPSQEVTGDSATFSSYPENLSGNPETSIAYATYEYSVALQELRKQATEEA